MYIIATISKNSYAAEKIEEILRAGADVLRYNFSHGTPQDLEAKIGTARGVMRSETPSDAVAAAPQYAELLDAGAAGFFAKLWAAIRGIGPSQPTNQANSGTERVGQRR